MSLAIGSEVLIRDNERILAMINKSFKSIEDFSQQYNKFVEMYNENINMDPNEYKEKDMDNIRTCIETYIEEEQEMEALQNTNDILIYRLDATNLRAIIKQSPTECLKQIHKLMPEIAYVRCSELCNELAESSTKVKRVPSNVDDYVDIMGYLRKQADRMDNLTTRFDEIQQLSIIIYDYKIKMPERNNIKFKETQSLLKVVRVALEDGLESGEANEQRYKRELEH
jgi:uncharacterized protein YozE (UPF0346 family)